ncbi:hypothetical protein HDV01_004565 [Terramyces sp. JEL0728]|nr:hypothetical protein HDV01_004565 [Terramyces sp. JEL0728]
MFVAKKSSISQNYTLIVAGLRLLDQFQFYLRFKKDRELIIDLGGTLAINYQGLCILYVIAFSACLVVMWLRRKLKRNVKVEVEQNEAGLEENEETSSQNSQERAIYRKEKALDRVCGATCNEALTQTNIPNVVNPKINLSKPRHFKSLFKPRTSPLDFETLILEKNPFRGFFILFWLSIAMKPQSLFFVLHTIAMLMKQHSYNSYNIALTFKKNRYAKLLNISKKEDYILSEDETLEMEILADELTRGDKPFPSNQTFANFLDYLLVPSLVYELHFPRTSRFRLWYFLERTFSLFASIGLLYLVIEHQCTPVFVQMPSQTFVDTLMDLLIPCMMCYLLIFYIIFEVH